MTCATCNGRGYVYRSANDQHGDVCLECTPAFLLEGPPPRKRNRGGGPLGDWYTGKSSGTPRHSQEPAFPVPSPSSSQRARRRRRFYSN